MIYRGQGCQAVIPFWHRKIEKERQLADRGGEGRGGAEEEPNNTTARNPGSLFIIQSSIFAKYNLIIFLVQHLSKHCIVDIFV
jgi:hypothetical protein